MNTTDLKIGDYVLYKNDPYKIWSLNGTIACIEPKQGRVMGALVESLVPIPLTFDILTRSGWSRTADEMCSMPFAFGRLNVVDCVDFDYYVIAIDSMKPANLAVLRRVKYIHELQHVLWALGVEDNIKL